MKTVLLLNSFLLNCYVNYFYQTWNINVLCKIQTLFKVKVTLYDFLIFKGSKKGKVHLRTGHEGPDGEV
jgi:hypothetical protein